MRLFVFLLVALALVANALGANHRPAPVAPPRSAAADPAPAANLAVDVAPRRKSTPRRRRPVYVACDANITVKAATTTCPFAENAFLSYWLGEDEAYSPAAGRMLAVSCVGGAEVRCTSDDGSVIRFPHTAADAYTAADARRFVRSHDTGTIVARAPTPAPTAAPAEPACDPSYAGACLDADALDYDCEGGSGEGPEYTGEVQVTGATITTSIATGTAWPATPGRSRRHSMRDQRRDRRPAGRVRGAPRAR